jgi:hypothetical protein
MPIIIALIVIGISAVSYFMLTGERDAFIRQVPIKKQARVDKRAQKEAAFQAHLLTQVPSTIYLKPCGPKRNWVVVEMPFDAQVSWLDGAFVGLWDSTRSGWQEWTPEYSVASKRLKRLRFCAASSRYVGPFRLTWKRVRFRPYFSRPR